MIDTRKALVSFVDLVGHFSKSANRIVFLLNAIGINCRRIGVNNNSRRRQKKPMIRRQAYFKALKNRR